MLVTEVITFGTAIVGLVGAILGSSACYFLSPRNNKTNITVLKDKVRALEDLIKDAQNKTCSTTVVVPDPCQWLEEAKSLLRNLDVKRLEKSLEERCVKEILADCWVRRNTRILVEGKFAELDDMTEQGKRILEESTVRGYRQFSEANVVGRSRRDIEDRIWKLLVSTEGVGTVCIHGTAGVGKTGVAIAIHNKALENVGSVFDHAIWVNMRYNATLCQVQEDIANQLGIELPNSSFTPERARILNGAMLKKERFLLVLDSLWQSFSIQDIGIPELVNGNRLIVTSRIRTVSVGGRVTRRKRIEVKPLPLADAWMLFEKEVDVGSKNLTKLDLHTFIETKAAVAALNGLPLAIKLMARALSEISDDKTPASLNNLWKIYLETSTPSSSYFEHSYDNLRVEAQLCLQLCAMFPQDYPFNSRELIEYWMWEGLLGDIKTLERSRTHGHEILKDLKDAHLLEGGSSGSDEDKVQMLNVVRHMAMVKAVPGGVFIKAGVSLPSLPPSIEWPLQVKRASFIQSQVESLVLNNSDPPYTQLSTLLLQHNPLTSTPDDSFFYNVCSLQVLDLSRTEIFLLPLSLSCLTSLRALLLRGCPNLTILPSLYRLQELIVLSLSGTPLEHCPDGLHTMTKLRSLDLNQTRIATFPSNVVGKLIKLEELLLFTDHDNSGYLWRSRVLHKNWKGACVEELSGMNNLAVLEINFLNAMVFNRYVKSAVGKSRTPPRFHFYVGDLQNVEPVQENSVMVSGNPSIMLPNAISELHLTLCNAKINVLQLTGCLKDLTVLDVSRLSRLSYLFTVEILGSLKMLRTLRVKSCKGMKGVVRPAALDNPAKVVHHKLTTIELFDLPMLQSVCRGQVLDCSSLLSLHVWRCDNLKLPMILGTVSKKVEIRGEKSWIENLTYDNPNNINSLFSEDEAPHSNPNLRFVQAHAPLKLESTLTRNNQQNDEDEEEEEKNEEGGSIGYQRQQY